VSFLFLDIMQLATLPTEYGLYSSFIGVLVYCVSSNFFFGKFGPHKPSKFFATSKDVSIGPVAVMSLVVAQIIQDVNAHHAGEWSSPHIATVLAFLTGSIVLGVGLLRLGWLVEFIPLPAVSGFMTGSALNIAVGQVPGLMGITGFKWAYPFLFLPPPY
jgi:solute carrier family 26 (sodium-independent sulfate anion transporter), member 11